MSASYDGFGRYYYQPLLVLVATLLLLRGFEGATTAASTASASASPETTPATTTTTTDGVERDEREAAAVSLGLPREFWNGTDTEEVRRAVELGKWIDAVVGAMDTASKAASAGNIGGNTGGSAATGRRGVLKREEERGAITTALRLLNLSDTAEWLFADEKDEEDEEDEEEDKHMGGNKLLVGKLDHLSNNNSSSSRIQNLVAQNWLFEFHRRLTSLEPGVVSSHRCVFRVYKERPSDAQVRLLAGADSHARTTALLRTKKGPRSPDENNDDDDALSVVRFDDRTFRDAAFDGVRHRGGASRLKEVLHRAVIDTVQVHGSFAVPTDEAADAIRRRVVGTGGDGGGKLLEMGAGTGYWSAFLKHRVPQLVDVVAYDASPTGEGSNAYFSKIQYYPVRKGTCAEAFVRHPELAASHALLLVWPNNPDNVDQPASFYEPGLEAFPVWDAVCLRSYLALGGRTVVYVGEREERVGVMPGAPPESGTTATREFQTLLKERMHLAERIELPVWWSSDDLTIWTRKEDEEKNEDATRNVPTGATEKVVAKTATSS